MAPRWLPETPDALRAALDNGVLSEGHFFDAKEQIAPGESAARRLAVDLASFAVDGGVVVAGVRENKEMRTFDLAPVPLTGLAERVIVDVAEGDLLRALRNLISNALTHGLGDRRNVHVAVSADADIVTFSVADSGPAFSADDLARLSQPLVRGAGVTGAGSGLGLAIVAEVLAAHGSTLDVAPRDGGGAVLSFALPRVMT